MRCAVFLSWFAILSFVGGCVHEISPVAQFSGLPGTAHAIAWSADGRHIAAAGEDDVHVWDAHSHQQVAQTNGHVRNGADYYEPTAIAFSPDGQWIAFGGAHGAVILWNWKTGQKRSLIGQSQTLRLVRFSPEGNFLATASGGFEYDPPVPSTRPVRLPRSAFHPVIDPMSVVVFDLSSGKAISRADAPGMLSIAFSYDSQVFAGTRVNLPASPNWPLTISDVRGLTAQVELRKTTGGKLLSTFPANGMNIAFSKDGKLWNGRTIYDTRMMKKIRVVPQGRPFFIDDGRSYLELETSSDPFSLWPVATFGWYRIIRTNVASGWKWDLGNFHGDGFDSALQNVPGYSPDQRWVVDRRMRLWPVPH